MFVSARVLVRVTAKRWALAFEMTRSFAVETLHLRAVFDLVSHLPAVRARVLETRIAEHDR